MILWYFTAKQTTWAILEWPTPLQRCNGNLEVNRIIVNMYVVRDASSALGRVTLFCVQVVRHVKV